MTPTILAADLTFMPMMAFSDVFIFSDDEMRISLFEKVSASALAEVPEINGKASRSSPTRSLGLAWRAFRCLKAESPQTVSLQAMTGQTPILGVVGNYVPDGSQAPSFEFRPSVVIVFGSSTMHDGTNRIEETVCIGFQRPNSEECN